MTTATATATFVIAYDDAMKYSLGECLQSLAGLWCAPSALTLGDPADPSFLDPRKTLAYCLERMPEEGSHYWDQAVGEVALLSAILAKASPRDLYPPLPRLEERKGKPQGFLSFCLAWYTDCIMH